MRLMIPGSGFQGSACAYDMLRNPAVTQVQLCDTSGKNLNSARRLIARVANGRATYRGLDAADPGAVKAALEGYDAVVSRVPYFLNLPLARVALEAGVQFPWTWEEIPMSSSRDLPCISKS